MNTNHLTLQDFNNNLLKSFYIKPLSFNDALSVLNDNFNKSLITEELYEKAVSQLDTIVKARVTKYYKREGSPGNYKYYYTKEEYHKKKVEGGKEGLRINESQRKTVENKPVGSIHEHNGKKYKKQANGKWQEVSEQGITKEEHKNKSREINSQIDRLSSYGSGFSSFGFREMDEKQKVADSHKTASSKLSDKEYTDEEVGLGEKKEEKYRIGGHKFKQEYVGSRIKITRQGEGEIKGQDKQGRFIIKMDNGEVKTLPKGGFKFMNKEYSDIDLKNISK